MDGGRRTRRKRRRIADLSNAICSSPLRSMPPAVLRVRISTSYFYIYIYIFFSFLLSLSLSLSRSVTLFFFPLSHPMHRESPTGGVVTRTCGGAHGWLHAWRASSFPHREICSNFSLPDATMYLPALSSCRFHPPLPHDTKKCRAYLCAPTRVGRTWPAMIMFSLFTGLYGALAEIRWDGIMLPLSAASNR